MYTYSNVYANRWFQPANSQMIEVAYKNDNLGLILGTNDNTFKKMQTSNTRKQQGSNLLKVMIQAQNWVLIKDCVIKL